jgi:hypothetical protein
VPDPDRPPGLAFTASAAPAVVAASGNGKSSDYEN